MTDYEKIQLDIARDIISILQRIAYGNRAGANSIAEKAIEKIDALIGPRPKFQKPEQNNPQQFTNYGEALAKSNQIKGKDEMPW